MNDGREGPHFSTIIGLEDGDVIVLPDGSGRVGTVIAHRDDERYSVLVACGAIELNDEASDYGYEYEFFDDDEPHRSVLVLLQQGTT
ncbi:MAG TPA: hypothetical protein VGZ32_10865 [Actinocrinis sp.]|uniref:hypothetical protein n=1 Tax=Actinocrinis sp. TaxID=1920516 RepID=UPI002DDCEC09|nr:hypothetical protein [Actinocrinis sp.]HEV3170834.1 hypothetical protein [Actinocrinis sp.]